MIKKVRHKLESLTKRIRNKRPKDCSQGGEAQIIERVFCNRPGGFYIDVGAHDPVVYNNTFGLYRKGWRGICIEPNAALRSRFQSIRPEDMLVNAAASDYEGQAVFHLGRYSVHGSLKYSTRRHVDKITVTVRRLDNLLKELGIKRKIDLISIDTEGTELDVLEGLDLSINRPHLIALEYNTASEINRKVQPYLVNHGYQVLAVTCWNIIATDRLEEDYAVLCPLKEKTTPLNVKSVDSDCL
jgi:FkbM family methyltransferase